MRRIRAAFSLFGKTCVKVRYIPAWRNALHIAREAPSSNVFRWIVGKIACTPTILIRCDPVRACGQGWSNRFGSYDRSTTMMKNQNSKTTFRSPDVNYSSSSRGHHGAARCHAQICCCSRDTEQLTSLLIWYQSNVDPASTRHHKPQRPELRVLKAATGMSNTLL